MSELAEPASICRPRLLWAISHQALARAELPILVEAGFDVVAEEPQREGVSIWEHDFVRYPTIDPLDSALLPVCASGDLGGRLRLVLRQGIVSTGEARDINYGFDAIMVDGPMKVAVNIASWFPGTVLWRVYGNLAVDQELDLTAPNLVCVPIFSGLLATPLGQAFGNCRALGTVVPVPPICVDTESAGRITVAVFAALISDEPWFDGWLSSLAEILGASDVAVFGVPAHNRGAVEAIGEHVRCLPRLDDEAYWREFARCSLAVYPHDIPHHSHYVPLEAILLGIPCLMTEHTAIASENVEMGLTGLPEAGVLPDRNAILWRVRELAVSPQKRRSLLREQMVLLEPFSHDNVLAQAKAIRALVSASASSRVKARVTGQSRVGIPSVLPLVRVLREGLVSPLSLAPSSICGPTRSFFHCDFHGEFIVEPDESIVKLRPSRGEDTFLRIGLVNTSGKSAEVVVRVAGSPVHRLPAVAELVNQDDPHDVATYQLERASNSAAEQAESCWSASLRVPPDSSVRLRIVGALLPVDYTVSEVTLVPLAQETGGGSTPSASFEQMVNAQTEVATATGAHTARVPGLIRRLSDGRIRAVRVPLRHVEAARLTLHSERIAEAGLAVQFCIVFVSSDGLRRPAPTGLFVQGHRLWSRDVNLQPNSVPLAIGTAKALLAWRLRLTGRGTSGPTVDED